MTIKCDAPIECAHVHNPRRNAFHSAQTCVCTHPPALTVHHRVTHIDDNDIVRVRPTIRLADNVSTRCRRARDAHAYGQRNYAARRRRCRIAVIIRMPHRCSAAGQRSRHRIVERKRRRPQKVMGFFSRASRVLLVVQPARAIVTRCTILSGPGRERGRRGL